MASPTELRANLDKFGLGFLFDVLNKAVLDPNVDVTDENQLVNAINSNPDAKAALDQRFIGNQYRAKAGLKTLKPSEYLALEQQYVNVLENNGMPAGFYDTPEDLGKLMSGVVSPIEFQNRIQDGYKAAMQAPQVVKDQLRQLYGVNESDLAAYFLDPTRAQDAMGRQKTSDLFRRQIQAAQVSAQAQQQAGMNLGVQTAEDLAAAGVTADTAQQGFQQISQSQEVFQATAAEQAVGEQSITAQEQVAGTFGTQAAARQKIAERRRRRAAEFEAGGGLSTTQTGVTGLRTAGQ